MDENKRRQISTSLIIGLIGPVTQWESVQTRLHKNVVPAPQPKGWAHQISNDFILNYKLSFEKSFIDNNFFMLNGYTEAVAGTMNDKASAGLSLMIGKWNDPYNTSTISKKNWELYLFGHSFVSAVGYDATLQGGMFNKKSPYTLSASEIKRVTLQSQIGAMLRYKKISIELSESFLSREFKSGRIHIWGGLGIGIELK